MHTQNTGRGSACAFSTLAAGLLGLTLLSGCGDDKTSKDVRENMTNTAESLGAFAEERYDQMRDWFSTRLDDAGDELKSLRERASSLQGEARERADASLDSLHAKWESLKGRMADLRDDGSDAWREGARKLREGWDEFRDALDRSKKELTSD
jgi:predicted nuclease with TOPRIM domain